VIVMKFGGTSVGSAERIAQAATLIAERRGRRPLVVVSAMAGVTDRLIRGARLALARDPAAEGVVSELGRRHESAAASLLPEGGVERRRVLGHVASVLAELHVLLTGVHYLEELTPRSLDAIAGLGERLSFELVAGALAARGVPARAVDARQVLVTDAGFGRASPLLEETASRLREHVAPLLEQGVVPVLPGFIGATRDGVATTLGRGGSDWSAALFGSLLGAEEIQIWTDVDGMLTVDPRVVPAARVLPELSFAEAAELAYFGAKVLHPATIKPAVEKGIPVRVLNTLNPGAPGTLILERAGGEGGAPRALAFKKGITVVLVKEPRMLMAHGFVARVFEAFARQRVAVDLIATSEVSISLSVDDATALPELARELAELGEVQVLAGMAIVSVVGRGFVKQPGLAARIFEALREVNVVMISFGASDVNLSFVVAEADAERAVRLLHKAFFETPAI
jgi:aspartate kinase